MNCPDKNLKASSYRINKHLPNYPSNATQPWFLDWLTTASPEFEFRTVNVVAFIGRDMAFECKMDVCAVFPSALLTF